MYLSGDYFIIMLLGAGTAAVLLSGLILSIVIFYSKKTVPEIIAWICGGLSLILYLALIHFGVAREFGWFDAYLLTLLLTFFLLLHYRSKSALGNKLKLVLIFRTVVILSGFSTICKGAINYLINSQLISYQTGTIKTLYTVQSVIFWCIVTSCCIWALYRIKPPLVKSEIFKTAVLFNWPVFFLVVTLGMLFFYIEYVNMNNGATISMLFNQKFLFNQMGFLIVGCTISAIIATSIYYYDQTAKNKMITN